VLPFRALFIFFEHFLTQGYIYLFKFGLTLISHYKDNLLSGRDFEIFQILRYDKELSKNSEIYNDDIICSIVERAATFEIIQFNIQTVREAIWKNIFEKRMRDAEEARKAALAENNGSEDSDDSEEGQSCDICDENVPDMWCKRCKKMICEMCHSKNAGGHSKKHPVDTDWVKYEDPNFDNE